MSLPSKYDKSEETTVQANYINKGFEGVILPEESYSHNNDSIESYSTTDTKGFRWSVGHFINLSCWKCCCHCSRNRQIHSEGYNQKHDIISDQKCVKNSNLDLREKQRNFYEKSTHDQETKFKNQNVTCTQVRHVQQLYSWDCGVSCVLMILPDKHYNYFAKNISKVSAEEGYQKSTWTIDLAYLLRRFKVLFHYTTITLGVDPGLSEEKFYSRVLSKDQLRVQDRFENAAANGITAEKKSMPLASLLEHLSKELPIIILVNANVLHCKTCSSDESSCLPRNKTSSYAGHFILLIGYSQTEEFFLYFDPAINTHTCTSSFKNIDAARFSYGTDEDILFIDHISS